MPSPPESKGNKENNFKTALDNSRQADGYLHLYIYITIEKYTMRKFYIVSG